MSCIRIGAEPIREVYHLQIVRDLQTDEEGNAKIRKVKKPMAFPVYRGVDTQYARFMRSQMKRTAAGKVSYPRGQKVLPPEPEAEEHASDVVHDQGAE